ncbi:hypothetical protein BU26DRAFT_492270 [Trematosphaeria pertusa]|uniref:Inner centromere protein ARK-binding domain-containing protein n=1 Tax=Trematosphaeria pertusa TaxID=390896 RepID=A0A6A6HZJ5_9PLEO|nr:uncharacterized protein BU26DRAFT_492270 [Trematosphaeria pertusa]KAF2243615.1 hypothetical protein BU26DRAFT_492270 [Trematosphaeria pertusa]
MAAARSKVPAIGSAQWLLDERHQSNDLVAQELEDFGFSVRNELEWLNEHMGDIFAQNGQNHLDVFKTPGKLRGKTPRTARKKPAEPRQPLGDLFSANSQKRPSPAEQSLRNNLHKNLAKPRFQIAEDTENAAPAQSPDVKSPVPRPLFSKALGTGKENQQSSPVRPESRPATSHTTVPVHFSPVHSTQDTVMTQDGDDVFSPRGTQSTQPTQATQSFGRSISADDERRDTGESFVSAKEAFGSKNASQENLRHEFKDDAMDIDDDRPDTSQSDVQDTVIRHELSSVHDETAIHHDIPEFPQPPRIISEQYSISADTQDALDTANQRAHAPEPKSIFAPSEPFAGPVDTRIASNDEEQHDDTVVHHEIDDQMDIDDDVRSPSDGSSPVKPLVRKSSLTFASLPAREPLIAKKSMGNRISRTSHVDQSKVRSSQLGRFTGGKSLGGSQLPQTDTHHHDPMDLEEERPELRREESETTKLHNKTSTQRLYERINMLKQQNEAPKRISQNVMSSQPSQATSFASSHTKELTQPSQPSQPVQASQSAYLHLQAAQPGNDDDDDDDWISPIRTTAPAPNPARPPFSKSYSADTRPAAEPILPKPISVSNPDLSTVVESTTPAGSPTGKKYMDGPLSASKAKFYSALRAAKEKIIGSSATSAQVKLDALTESPMRPKLKAQFSTEDIFSPKRTEKASHTLFSHLRSPSKESDKSGKSAKVAAGPGSPMKDDGRRTRSSSERERQKEKEAREKEMKQKQRAEDRLKELREKEQSKAAAHYQKTKAAAAKTPVAMSSQQNIRQAAAAATKTPISVSHQSQARPGMTRMNTGPRPQEPDSADEMPPPPPPKSNLPTTAHKLREPKKLLKASSKDTLPKAKPQKIMVNLNSSRYGPAPAAASRNAPPAAPSAPAPATSRMGPPAPKPAPAAPKVAPTARPASALSSKSGTSSKAAPVAAKSASRMGRPQPPKAVEKPVEKPKAPAPQPRADLAAAKPVSRMQTVQDVNRIIVPPVNPAKPAKRPFQPENDEPLHRPAKRPSQQAKMNPITPAHAQFAKGKIPFAEPSQLRQPPQPQYPNGEDIKLPEIMTDSEDEDSENEFEQPSWVNTPNLRELLTQQQLVDPEQIFGPIAPLNMEQVFPNKERHKRFRERTSSAYWTNDQLTEEEKQKERAARERIVREGAWTYNPSPRPTPRPGL